jgi:hypothetical protein
MIELLKRKGMIISCWVGLVQIINFGEKSDSISQVCQRFSNSHIQYASFKNNRKHFKQYSTHKTNFDSSSTTFHRDLNDLFIFLFFHKFFSDSFIY